MTAFEKLCEIVAKLRAPDGCPWDREQTHESLLPALIEEAYEAVGAVRANDTANFREELGDLLLLVVMHAQIASESGRFDINGVTQGCHGETDPEASTRIRQQRCARQRRSAKTMGIDQAR